MYSNTPVLSQILRMSESVRRPRVTIGGRRRLSSIASRTLHKTDRVGAAGTYKVRRVHKKSETGVCAKQLDLSSQIFECEITPITETPSKCFELSAAVGSEAPAAKPKKSRSEVHGLLLRAGIEDPDSVCVCLRAGISYGCINMDKDNPLEQIILNSNCYLCSAVVVVKLKDVLYQGPTGGSYWSGYENDVICPNTECQECFVVSEMCTSRPELNNGKFYNHCEECTGFGQCIGDYRQSHCSSCGEHYFAGSTNQYRCPCSYSSSEGEDEGMGLFGSFFTNSLSQDTPIFSFLYKEQETVKFDEMISESDLSKSEAFYYLLHHVESSGEDTLTADDNSVPSKPDH